ncbi:NAD-dependent epimerase/dehydratase family protein [Acetobacterium wieringae]|uniref:CDP-abequose synthase n=1 Tax=Acetobacterium wieringae TaxID=52694 RepID=A0A1F2PGD9_9FIRM|nr:NAD-dependent epimerase/dehydratase family protein [Acetobacterium wieringae]OFV70024.1 CDP-abequose synthase [Acetobacterium wieringae]
MKILLTGATGFLGSYLLKEFIHNNYQVIVLKRSTSNIFRIKEAIPKVKYYDIDKINIKQVFMENPGIDAIFHTATCYGRKAESLKEMINTNLVFPLEILEVASQENVKEFWNIDTVLFRNTNHYALSKKQFKDWGRDLALKKKIKFYNLKMEHMYGRLDDNDKFITYVLNKCLSNKGSIDLTFGEQKRDFIYIEDVVKIINFLLNNIMIKDANFKEFEVGTGTSIKIKDAVKIIKKATKSNVNLNFGALNYRENELMESSANLDALIRVGYNIDLTMDFCQGIKCLLNNEEFNCES